MVQRTGLALIILLAFIAITLLAQESVFTPPKLLSEAVLEIPENWSQTYTPPEVSILIEVWADSTAILMRILDGKTELQPLIAQKLNYMKFSPALQKDVPINSNLNLKLAIVRDNKASHLKQFATSDSLRQINKDMLQNWINRQRQAENLQQIFSSQVDTGNTFSPKLTEAMYRTNLYQVSLNGSAHIINKDSFITPNSVFYNSFKYQMLSNFRRVNVDDGLISFANEKYLLPAMCTDVYAGLGDYEFNFAKVQALKNHVFGVKDFYTEFGFIVQNGYWQEIISDQTSSRIFFSLPLSQTRFILNWENYEQNIPSSTLLPGMQNGINYKIGHELKDIYLKWELPWVTLGWKSYKESLKNSSFLNNQDYHQQQALISTKTETSIAIIDLQYQHSFNNNLPQQQTLYQINDNSKHQLLAVFSKQLGSFDYDTQLFINEKSFQHGLFNCGVTGSNGRIGTLLSFNNQNTITQVPVDFYGDEFTRFFPSAYVKESYALQYKTPQRVKDFAAELLFGTKRINSKIPNLLTSDTITQDNNLLYSEAVVQYRKYFWGKYTALIEQTGQWTQYHDGVFEQPELQGQTRLKITRDMGFDNSLSCGVKLTGHTDYIQASMYNNPVYGAMVMDLWTGVKITDLFEFQIMMQNVGSNQIFGVSPHPRSIIATIHWFYLN